MTGAEHAATGSEAIDVPIGAGVAATGKWAEMDVWERLAVWEKKSPDTANELIQLLKAERRHAHRLDWANWAKQVMGALLGFGCVLVMAYLAWHYADLGSPLNGAIVMGAGTGGIVAIFVTGRYVVRSPRE